MQATPVKTTSPTIERALISVSDKAGLADLGKGLAEAGVEMYSTGGTRKALEDAGVPVKDVSEYTGFPEMMDGRLKTLHPKVFGGILCRHDNESDMSAIAEHGILSFELVVVNLYPFQETVAKPDVTKAEAIEKIDIGGPSLVRAAAKNQAFTTIATDPRQYDAILEQVRTNKATTPELRTQLASEAFAHTAGYDQAIAAYHAGQDVEDSWPATLRPNLERRAVMRYGENPHMKAAIYADVDAQGTTVLSAEQLNGKQLSYNNYLDLDSAFEIARYFDEPACSVIKHTNPCGAAIGATLVEAVKLAMAGDPLSAFGSVLGMNQVVDVPTAELLAEPGLFIEAIIAPDFEPEALEILTTRPKWKKNVRLMKAGEIDAQQPRWAFRSVHGGMLVQEADVLPDDESTWKVVTQAQPTDQQMIDLRFAWKMGRVVKSNAIVLCKDGMLLGAGAGQMSRVDSTEIAIKKAGDRGAGSALGSDAFFPFPDAIEAAAAAGVTCIIQPGGSKGDEAVIAACNEHGIAMVFTGCRHFRH
ncbi:MAG: bifunctional phosphoribosylaminoimidazolecarboxamide formyltransferase/IMP cyclohydrolase [Planctomycetota bacterium]|nr:bifunctional phosphoribosylaminoimidazolecarboxamide formyltransferase/IMP cyclohydrolase [Planctomycetota bacterium]